MIYHGVRQTAAGLIYRLGLALFDSNAPDQRLERDNWLDEQVCRDVALVAKQYI